MPLEPLPWDRKDFFKERKNERPSESLGGSSVSRWRETPHHGSSRWGYADFRRPTGHGKQGGWHLYPEESGHGFVSSRSSEKMLDDESCRSSGSRGEGKYGRSSREHRGFLSQKEWINHSWETTLSPNGPGRLSDMNGQRSVDDMLAYNSHPHHSDFVNSWDQLHFKDQNDKNDDFNGLSTGQRVERENSFNCIDWKPLKWTRSGSLSSRGSGFSHSSDSKSNGVYLDEMKAEVQARNVVPVQSPSGDPCVSSVALSEETSSRKKPRLNWGEGLAKYEKKKVEGPDDGAVKNGVLNNTDPLHSHGSNMADKSPRVTGSSDCGSPATPSSVACSSSPGLEDKIFIKASTAENNTSYLSGSPGFASQNHSNLENLDLTQLANLSTSLSEFLQSDDPSPVDSGFMRATAINKLLVLKGDILKALEMTESEIDLLENVLKSLISDSGGCLPCPGLSTSLPMEEHINPCEEVGPGSNLIPKPAPLHLVSSRDMIVDKTLSSPGGEHAEVKDEDVDSPGTVTSKFVEPLSLGKTVILYDSVEQGECSRSFNTSSYENLEERDFIYAPNEDKASDLFVCRDGHHLMASTISATASAEVCSDCNGKAVLCDLILASNKDSANGAVEVFNKLLPSNQCHASISRSDSVSCCQNDAFIKEKFVRRKRFVKFKERVIALKFRAFQHLWKEDMRLLSVRKCRAKSQLSSRTLHSVYQKHCSPILSRFSSPAGNSLVPTKEIIYFTGKMLSDSQCKTYGKTLKMPALNLDNKEKTISRFISSNGLVEDPCAVERERSMINPWTSEEKEIFMDKLATIGKDFRRIASFLDHKTTADCVEFYYKNHKSYDLKTTKKNPKLSKLEKSYSNSTYLVTSGKRWNREMNAASLDMLGAASAIVSNDDDDMESVQKCTSRFLKRVDDGILEKSSSLDIFGSDRETAAANVLAGICGSLSSEAMRSCIKRSVDPGGGYSEWECRKVGSFKRRPLTPDVTQSVDDETCSDDSCGEMDPAADWTDEEKSIFVKAVSSYGKDFAKISCCVGTRTSGQCKVFFSKARKCLGLDVIHHGLSSEGALVRDGANGGVNDTEDACLMETGSVICGDKSACKMDEDQPTCDVKVSHVEAEFSGTIVLLPELNLSEHNKTGDVDLRSSELRSEDIRPRDNLEPIFDGDCNIGNCISAKSDAIEDHGNVVIPCDFEAGRRKHIGPGKLEELMLAGEANDNGLATRFSSEVEIKAADEVCAAHSRAELEKQKCILQGSSLCSEPLENNDANKGGSSVLNTCQENFLSVPESAGSAITAAADTSSSGFSNGSGKQQKTALGLDAGQKPHVINLQPDNFLTSNSDLRDSAVFQIEDALNLDTLPLLDFEKISDKQGPMSAGIADHHPHSSKCPLLEHVESSQILRAQPLPRSTAEMNEDISCNKPAALQSIAKLDKNLHSDRYLVQECYLQKCNRTKHELPLLSQEQMREHERPPSRGSLDSEKPCRNGDVKLFGQILTHPSHQQKQTLNAPENEDTAAQHPKLSGKCFNLRSNGNHSVHGNSVSASFNRNYSGVENLPTRSYGFWDGNRVQTSFASLPDSAILLSKYPAAFVNYPSTSPRVEQQPLHAIVRSNEHAVTGVSAFPTREASSSSSSCSNGAADFHPYRGRDGGNKVRPFTVDINKRQDILREMQRRNGFESVAGVQQQQTRGMVGINLGRGVLVGGPCSGVSDPVAALRMHYAKAEQFGGQAGSFRREDDSWRGTGDIGR